MIDQPTVFILGAGAGVPYGFPTGNSGVISQDLMMQCNLSQTDRGIRVVLGVGLIGTGLYFRSWWGLLGVPLLINAAMGFCGLYRLLGISTYRKSRRSPK